MKVLLCDDEKLAIQYMSRQLEHIENVEIVAVCADGKEVLKKAAELKPEVIFLDIQMPEMNGLEVAEHLKQQNPATHIVFVTAYDQYAIQAFELNAIDYLLKPVKLSRLEATMTRLEQQIALASEHASASKKTVTPIFIRCFQRLLIEREQPIDIKWRTSKAKELFAYLLHFRKQHVSKEQIIDTLWPEIEFDRAHVQLYSTVYQIRRTLNQLKLPIQIKNSMNGYEIKLHNARIDVEEWEQEVYALPELTNKSLPSYIQIFEKFTGDYLQECAYLWAEPVRERLRNTWLDTGVSLGQFLEQHGQRNDALRIYHRITTIFPIHEMTHWRIMKIYDELRNWPAVESHYHHLMQILNDDYGIELRQEIRDWYEAKENT